MSQPSDPFDFSGYTAGIPTQSAPGTHGQLGGPRSGAPQGTDQWGGQGGGQGGFGDPFAFDGPPQQGRDATQAGFGLGPDVPAAPLHAARPPVAWLLAAAGVAVVGGVLAGVLGGSIALAGVGWALSGPLAIGLLALFTQRDTQARATPVYLATSWVRPAYVAVLVLVVVAIGLSAWRIAEWAGRL